MVIERSIDVDDTDEDYMDGESDEGIFFEDDDLQNEFQAPTLVNPSKKPAKFTIPWKSLRLHAAQGEGRSAAPSGPFDGSGNPRSSPYAYVIPYKSWQQYISNMDATDVAAEMNAPVSDTEKASLYLFAEEWRLDITHEAFKRRLIDHPLVNVAQETAKGQLVFDIVTGKVTAKGGRPDTKHEEMLRLAMDILQSIRLRYYSYYSVNLLHSHEGAAVYEEFLSRYVPLEAQEVAIIAEIEMGIRAQGRSYAVNTSNPMADAVTTFNLMMRVVESYNIGDTMTARAGISALLQAPINYRSSARHTVNTDSLGRSGIVTSGNIVGIAFKGGDMKEAKKGTEVRYMLKKALNSDEELPSSGRDNQLSKLFNGKHWVEVKGVNDSTPISVWSTRGGSKLNSQRYEDYLNLGAAAQAVQETLSPARKDRPKRGSVKVNPGVMSNVPFDFASVAGPIQGEKQRLLLDYLAKGDDWFQEEASKGKRFFTLDFLVDVGQVFRSGNNIVLPREEVLRLIDTVNALGFTVSWPDDKTVWHSLDNHPYIAAEYPGVKYIGFVANYDLTGKFKGLNVYLDLDEPRTGRSVRSATLANPTAVMDNPRVGVFSSPSVIALSFNQGGLGSMLMEQFSIFDQYNKKHPYRQETFRMRIYPLNPDGSKYIDRDGRHQVFDWGFGSELGMNFVTSRNQIGNWLLEDPNWQSLQQYNSQHTINHWGISIPDWKSVEELEAWIQAGNMLPERPDAPTPLQPVLESGMRIPPLSNPVSDQFMDADEALATAKKRAMTEGVTYYVASLAGAGNGRGFGIATDENAFYDVQPDFSPFIDVMYTVFSSGKVWSDRQKAYLPEDYMTNPVAIGKGQHFFIQLAPKSQFSFNAKQKKMGATAKGSMTVVGTPGRDSTGLVDLFGGFEEGGYVAWKGTHKDSGSSKAWIIQLPRKYGKGKSRGKGGDTVFKAARVTDKKTGKSYRTIKPFTADKKIKAAWDKFVALYGEPVFADDPKRPNLFRVRRQGRGTYYKRK